MIAATTHTGVIVGLVQCRLCSSIDHVACTVSAAARSFARVVSGLKRSGRDLVSAAVVAWSQLQCVRELTWASALDQVQRLRSQLERWQRVRRIASQLTDHTSSDRPLLCGITRGYRRVVVVCGVRQRAPTPLRHTSDRLASTTSPWHRNESTAKTPQKVWPQSTLETSGRHP